MIINSYDTYFCLLAIRKKCYAKVMLMESLFGSDLSKLSVLILIMLAACSPAYAEDLSGKWKMVANDIYTFDLDLQQSGDQITGTMTCTSNPSEPVDTISGTVHSGGYGSIANILFTRERAGQWTQVYSGSLSGSTITGNYNHNNQGQYPWSANKVNNAIFTGSMLSAEEYVSPAPAQSLQQCAQDKVALEEQLATLKEQVTALNEQLATLNEELTACHKNVLYLEKWAGACQNILNENNLGPVKVG